MNWTEIKSTLVRRWPDKFFLDEDGELGMKHPDSFWPVYFAQSLNDIAAICEAIGAVVWSVPFDISATKYECWFALPGSERFHSIETDDVNGYMLFETREAAELAALGEWLKATEVE